jgi:hypothetical protein
MAALSKGPWPKIKKSTASVGSRRWSHSVCHMETGKDAGSFFGDLVK